MGNPPGAGDHHGCPYRHYDEEHLSNLLSQVVMIHASQFLGVGMEWNGMDGEGKRATY